MQITEFIKQLMDILDKEGNIEVVSELGRGYIEARATTEVAYVEPRVSGRRVYDKAYPGDLPWRMDRAVVVIH